MEFDLTFTEKLVFEKIIYENEYSHYYLSSFFKKEFIDKQLIISLVSGNPITLFFYSSEFGNCKWDYYEGFIDSERWENEEETEKNLVTKHFTVSFSIKNFSTSYIFEKIIPDVLSCLLDENFAELINEFIITKTNLNSINWINMIENYKLKSLDFLNKKQ